MIATEVVITNWKRPSNVAEMVRALKSQSVPCTITICDCHPSAEFALDEQTLSTVDRLYRWQQNWGGYNRYVPAGAYDHPFTFFLDDDMLPGERCVEHFLAHAARLESFGVLGQLGRIISPDNVYRWADVNRSGEFIETDFVVRGYFVRTENLHYIQQFRWKMGLLGEAIFEDDMLLCASLRACAGLSCYLTPSDDEPETLVNKLNLDEAFAISARDEHLPNRTGFLRRAMDAGWTPLHARCAEAVSSG